MTEKVYKILGSIILLIIFLSIAITTFNFTLELIRKEFYFYFFLSWIMFLFCLIFMLGILGLIYDLIKLKEVKEKENNKEPYGIYEI